MAGATQESKDDLITNKEQGQINEMSQRFESERPSAARSNFDTNGVDAKT
jgi:hypothetical protein